MPLSVEACRLQQESVAAAESLLPAPEHRMHVVHFGGDNTTATAPRCMVLIYHADGTAAIAIAFSLTLASSTQHRIRRHSRTAKHV